jgi:hypothetical protein
MTFLRFGFPPNALGYCGPDDVAMVAGAAASADQPPADAEHLISAFLGAWPYLELIGGLTGHSPLDEEVVEAYWLGGPLLDRVDTLAWGNSLEARFRDRAGWDWEAIASGVNAGGVPSHAFHVFCVYPWVGLLRAGLADHALEVLDRCRIRWGRVTANTGGEVLVESRPLAWDGRSLGLGPARVEAVDPPPAAGGVPLEVGAVVAMHWNYVCQTLVDGQLESLRAGQARHLSIVNGTGNRFAHRIEG